MRKFRKIFALLVLIFAFALAFTVNAFAEDAEEEIIEQGETEEEQTEVTEAEDVAPVTDGEEETEAEPVGETEPVEEASENTENTEKTEETENVAADEDKVEDFSEYAKRLIDKVTSSSFVASIVSFVSGIVALLFMNRKSSDKMLGFIGEKADSALVKKEFKGIAELDKNMLAKQDELSETVKQLSVALMLIAEYLPSVPSTVKGELFKNFSGLKDSGKTILDSLSETKGKIEEAVSSIPAIDTSALTKVLNDVENTVKEKVEKFGQIDLG